MTPGFSADFTKLFETRIIPRTGDPVWNEQHTVAVAHDCQEVLFLIKDNDRLSAEHVAEVSPLICCSHAKITLAAGPRNIQDCIIPQRCAAQDITAVVPLLVSGI